MSNRHWAAEEAVVGRAAADLEGQRALLDWALQSAEHQARFSYTGTGNEVGAGFGAVETWVHRLPCCPWCDFRGVMLGPEYGIHSGFCQGMYAAERHSCVCGLQEDMYVESDDARWWRRLRLVLLRHRDLLETLVSVHKG